MAEDTPPVIRSVITDDEFGGFRITIPATGGEGGRCGFGCGLAAWAVVTLLTLLYIVSDPGRNFTDGIRFLGFCATVGALLVVGLLYATTARQVVMIEGKTLVLRWEMAGYCRNRTFDLAGVRNLRSVRASDAINTGNRWNAVAFDYEGKTYHFGVGLSEHEVVRLVKTIRMRFPIRDDWDDVEPLPIIT